MFFNRHKKGPLDIKTSMKLVSRGKEAEGLLRALGPKIQEWKDWLFDCIASAEPDGMVYAKYAGMVEMIRTMEKELKFQKHEGDSAWESLEKQQKKSA